MKAETASQVKKFIDIPNIGPAMVKDFAVLGIKTKSNQDPCVLDTFIAAVDFMHGAPARPWWYYTKERKAQMGK